MNLIPPEVAPIDLNQIPTEAAPIGSDAQEEDDLCLDAQEEEKDAIDQEPNHEDVEHPTKSATNLTDKQRYGVYFALEVIRSRDGYILPDDKLLVASLLNTIVRTVKRIWQQAYKQLEEGLEVDIYSKKKGRSGRKRKELEMSRIATVPLNKRRIIRALSRSLGICPSTLHARV